MKTAKKVLGLLLVCTVLFGVTQARAQIARAADSTATTVKDTPYAGMDFFALDGEVVYCAERKMAAPENTAYQKIGTTADAYAADSTGTEDKKWWRDDQNQWENIRKILYLGYPNNGKDMQGTLTADQFRAATQEALWYYTNSLALTDGDAAVKSMAQSLIDSTESVPSDFTVELWSPAGTNSNGIENNSVYQSLLKVGAASTESETGGNEASGEADSGEAANEETTDKTLATQVKLGEKAADDEPLKLTMDEGAKAATITDTITYKNLTEGGSYILKSVLASFDESGKPTTIVENPEETVTADGEPWTVSFTVEGGLKPYTKYGVVQTLKKAEGTVDDSIPEEGKTENADGSVPAQTILVGDFYGNFPFDPMGSPEGGKPAIGTVVSAGGQTATTQNPVTLSAETAAKVTEVTDQIAYVGMEPNATYKVTGTLMRVIVRNNKTYVARVATVTEDVVANGVGAGTEWTITFKNVKLQENTKYVVFEEVYNAEGKKIAEHKDVDDPAQTIVVSGASSNTSPKTADRIWPAALLPIALIVAGLLLLGRRRKFED